MTHNKNDLCLSIKNYADNNGLSKYIHETFNQSQKCLYQVRGPMGSGISVQSQGKHIAFTAGTGVLVFMDLVAYLLIRVIEQNGGPSITGGAAQLNGGNSSLAIAKSEGAETRETRGESGATIGNADPIDLQNFSFELHTSFSSVDVAYTQSIFFPGASA